MKEIGIGLVGAGCIGNYHSKGYARVRQIYGSDVVPKFIIAADLIEDRAKAACDQYGYAKWTTDWHDVVNNPDVDVVLVTVPNYIHAEVAIAAANAGKHVMCEKPMGMTAEESKAIVSAVEANNVKSLVNFTYTKLPVSQYLSQIINEGEIGDIVSFRGFFDCDYCADPSTPSTWRQYAKYAGTGAIGDLLAHVVSLSDMFVGEQIDQVFASSDIVYNKRPENEDGKNTVEVDTDDQVYVIVKYKNGRIGTISSSRVVQGYPADIWYEVEGTKGTAKYTLGRMNELDLFLTGNKPGEYGFKNIKANSEHGDYAAQTAYPYVGIGYADIFTIQAHDFLTAIAQNKEVNINIAYSNRVDKVLFAVEKSAKENRWVKISEID